MPPEAHMSGESIFTNAVVVTRDDVFFGSVRVAGGNIVAVERGRTAVAGAVDLDGDLLVPGLVELHTDNLERHFQPRPGVVWPSAAALAGHDAQLAAAGITTVLDSLSVGEYERGSVRKRILDESANAIRSGRAGGSLRIDHWLHMRLEICDPEVVPMFEPYAGDPLVRLASLMDHTPGQRQWSDKDMHKRFIQGRNGWSDAEADRWLAVRIGNQARWAGPNRAALLALCRRHGLLTASHDDTTAGHVEEAVASGISISEFPTSREAAAAARAADMRIVMGAPNVVRGGSHSGNVSAAALAADGLLDALASDYVPISLMHGALLLHETLGIALPDAVATVSLNPARMAGFDDRGEIAPGQRADLVQVRLADGVPVVRRVWREGERVV